jgi:hypothetical protein
LPLCCFQELRLGERPQGFDHVHDEKVSTLNEEIRNMSRDWVGKSNFAGHPGVSRKELLHDDPPLVEELHEIPVVKEGAHD